MRRTDLLFLFLPFLFYSYLLLLDNDLMAMTTLDEIIYAVALMQRLIMGCRVGDLFLSCGEDTEGDGREGGMS